MTRPKHLDQTELKLTSVKPVPKRPKTHYQNQYK